MVVKIIYLIFFLIIINTALSAEVSQKILKKAHEQYENRELGYKSSYLPRVGKTRGGDYQNCIKFKYYGKNNQIDFCSWHAGVG
jgi:hypothetical protein